MIGVYGNLIRISMDRSRGWDALEGMLLLYDAFHEFACNNNIVIHFNWYHFLSAKLIPIAF